MWKVGSIYVPTSNVRSLRLITFWKALDNTSIIIHLYLIFFSFSLKQVYHYVQLFLVKCCYTSPFSFYFQVAVLQQILGYFYTQKFAKISHLSYPPHPHIPADTNLRLLPLLNPFVHKVNITQAQVQLFFDGAKRIIFVFSGKELFT